MPFVDRTTAPIDQWAAAIEKITAEEIEHSTLMETLKISTIDDQRRLTQLLVENGYTPRRVWARPPAE